MKIVVFVSSLVVLVALVVILFHNETSVEIFPAEAAEGRAADSIEAGGSDPAAWEFETVCLNMGSCTVTVSAKADDSVSATNRYTVKDSKPSLNGSDSIRELAGSSGL